MKTAEDFLNGLISTEEGIFYRLGEWESSQQENDVKWLMIEFAKMHVKAALEAASHQASVDIEEQWEEEGTIYKSYYVNPKSVTNAYPESNIK